MTDRDETPHRIDPLPEAGRGRPNRFEAIDPARTALLVIDLQHAFLDPDMPGCAPAARATVAPSNRIAAALRARGGLVVFTRHSFVEEGPGALPAWQTANPLFARFLETVRLGTAGHALVPGCDVRSDDLEIDKTRYSAFLPGSSPIDAELKARGIDTIVITGTMTDVCCESSARDAQMMGYRVLFVADATATSDDARHNATLRAMDAYFADVRMTDDVIALIG